MIRPQSAAPRFVPRRRPGSAMVLARRGPRLFKGQATALPAASLCPTVRFSPSHCQGSFCVLCGTAAKPPGFWGQKRTCKHHNKMRPIFYHLSSGPAARSPVRTFIMARWPVPPPRYDQFEAKAGLLLVLKTPKRWGWGGVLGEVSADLPRPHESSCSLSRASDIPECRDPRRPHRRAGVDFVPFEFLV